MSAVYRPIINDDRPYFLYLSLYSIQVLYGTWDQFTARIERRAYCRNASQQDAVL